MSATAPFSLLTAFSTRVEGGNPAAVVFIDLSLPIETFKTIARNFNQPITAFLSSSPIPSNDPKTVAFHVRWFTPNRQEIDLCGHGTIAAAKAVFEREDLVSKETEIIEFHTLTRGIMTARKCDGGFIEIQLPAGDLIEILGDENDEIRKVLARTFGKEVSINYIGAGREGFEDYLMVEIDKKENLKDLPVDGDALRDAGFSTNIFTTASLNGEERFISRMFAPGFVPGDEDHVCGSAHCLMTPYWSRKLGIASQEEIVARQVSPRGGDLKLVWSSDEKVVRLRGQLAVLATGEVRFA